jgi:hypothetical protein
MTLKPLLIQGIASLLLFLFIYAALSKLFNLVSFQATLYRSPLIGPNASWVAIAVPIIELMISVLLFLPQTRRLGLLGSFSLMLLFTGYISYLILFAAHLPCSCGGVLQTLNWKEHWVFNLLFALLAFTGVLMERKGGSEGLQSSPD